MILGIALMENKSDLVEEVKHLDKRSQIELLRSLMQQLEPDVVEEASKDVVINVGNNNNKNNITYADIVLNLYCNEDPSMLANLLDAAAYRLRNADNREQGTGNSD
jgi:hypothetical protein